MWRHNNAFQRTHGRATVSLVSSSSASGYGPLNLFVIPPAAKADMNTKPEYERLGQSAAFDAISLVVMGLAFLLLVPICVIPIFGVAMLFGQALGWKELTVGVGFLAFGASALLSALLVPRVSKRPIRWLARWYFRERS